MGVWKPRKDVSLNTNLSMYYTWKHMQLCHVLLCVTVAHCAMYGVSGTFGDHAADIMYSMFGVCACCTVTILLCCVMSCHVMSCQVKSRSNQVMSCHVMSCLVMVCCVLCLNCVTYVLCVSLLDAPLRCTMHKLQT
jgi:hypothetical protein